MGKSTDSRSNEKQILLKLLSGVALTDILHMKLNFVNMFCMIQVVQYHVALSVRTLTAIIVNCFNVIT